MKPYFPGKNRYFIFMIPSRSKGFMPVMTPIVSFIAINWMKLLFGRVVRYDIRLQEDETLYLDLFKDVSNRLTEPINGALDVYGQTAVWWLRRIPSNP